MALSKVSVVWRIGFILVLGAIFGTFTTIAIITKRLETGDTINIGKIKIKNASHIELPIIIQPSESTEKKKEKRKKRKNGRTN